MLKAFYYSLFNIDWLVTQRNRLGWAWLYVTVFLFVISVIVTATTFRMLMPIFTDIKTVVTRETPEFQAELKAGVLTVNGPQQWEFKKSDAQFVMDVRATSTAAIASYRDSSVPVILLTSTTLNVYDNQSARTHTVLLATYGEGNWDKGDLVAAAEWVVTSGVKIMAVAFFVVFWLGGVIGKAAYAGLVALVLWSMLTSRHDALKSAWSWRQVWTVSLFALTLPTLIQQIMRWSGFMIPGLYTLVLGGLVYLALRTPLVPTEPEKTAAPAPVDTPV